MKPPRTAPIRRRDFLAAAGALTGAGWQAGPPLPSRAPAPEPKFKLGTITYNLGAKWDLATLLKVCKATGLDYVELRTSHAHKVEPSLSRDERLRVRQQFEEAGVRLWSFGTVCEFQSPDPATVRRQIDECRAFCQLARDLGAKGVKVRPNGLPSGVDTAKTLDQIGAALAECGKAAEDHGVEVWVEVHGRGTQIPTNLRTILDRCAHRSVGACWNSNPTDVKEGSIRESFDFLKKDLKSCHINELWSGYPYRELFAGLREIGYDRLTLIEVPGVPEEPGASEPAAAIRFLRYYKALWTELAR